MSESLSAAAKDRLAALSPEQRRALLAKLQEGRAPSTARAAQPGIPRRPADAPLVPSFAQERLWFMDQLHPGSALYNIKAAVRLRGVVSVAGLQRCLDVVAARHDALSVRLLSVRGRLQVEAAPAPTAPTLRVESVADAGDDAARQAAAAALVADEARRPFDLARGPLWRALLVRLSETEHQLLLTMHHVASDGWSAGVLVAEIAALYPACVRDGAATTSTLAALLPPLSITHADAAAWQRAQLTPERLKELLARAAARLSAAPPRLPLAFDAPRPPVAARRGSTRVFTVDKTLAQALQRFATAHHTSLFSVLLTGFQALLTRMTGADDMVVGTAISGRTQPELEGLIGCFVNVVPLRLDGRGADSMTTLLQRTDAALASAIGDVELPFEKLVDHLRHAGDGGAGDAAPFDVAFIFDNAPLRRVALGPAEAPLTVEPLHVDDGMATFDLSVSVGVVDDGLRLAVEADSALFADARIDTLVANYRGVLQSLVDAPDAAPARLPVARPIPELQALQPAPSSSPSFLTQVWTAARAQPDATAARASGVSLSYRDLTARAAALGDKLSARGVGGGDVVGLSVAAPLDRLVAMLAVLRAGAAFLPLDATQPAARRALLLSDARPRVVLVDDAGALALPRDLPLLAVDGVAAAPASGVDAGDTGVVDDVADRLAHHAATPAYVIYTSGSTGTPKGVVVSRGSLAAHSRAVIEAYALTSADRVFAGASPSFDLSLEELLPTLAAGAAVVFRDDDTLSDVALFEAFVRAQQLTLLNLPTAFFPPWVEALRVGTAGVPSSVRLVIIGGEAADAAVAATWQRHSAVPLRNAYGPTEATITATTQLVRPAPYQRVPIGVPLGHARAYVLDDALRPVPAGVLGDLYVGGDAVALGYLHRPALTASSFLPDPFALAPGQRMYRTGDRAQQNPDGSLVFCGRGDDQLKIRGFRIEPAEVEAALRSHPNVSDAVVLPRATANGHLSLVAYLLGTPTPLSSIAGAVAARLPAAVAPSHLVWLAAWPLTSSGKIDRRALAALPLPVADRVDDTDAPSSGTSSPHSRAEQIVAAVFASVLGIELPGLDADFFALGGDSIQAIQVVSRARAQGLRVTARALAEHPTVRGLAASHAAAANASDDVVSEPTPPGPVPLSPMQRWFFAQRFAAPHHWNMSIALALPAGTTAQHLRPALRALVNAHAALRTRFVIDAADPPRATAHVVADADVPLLVGARGPAANAVDTAADALHPAFHLQHGPLFGAALVPGDACDQLVLVAHHLVVDGVSWRVIADDLALLLAQARAGLTSLSLPAATTPFATHVRQLESAVARGELSAGAPPSSPSPPSSAALPADRPGLPSVASAAVHEHTFSVDDTQRLLRVAAPRVGARVDELLLSALLGALWEKNGPRPLTLDLEAHGREALSGDVDLSRTVGWFTSLSAEGGAKVAGYSDDVPAPLAALASVRRTLRAIPRHGLGHLAVTGGAHENADVVFNHLGDLDGNAALPLTRESPGALYAAAGHRHHAVEVEGMVLGGRLVVRLTASANIHDSATVKALLVRLVAHVGRVVDAACAVAAAPLVPSDFPLALPSPAGLARIVEQVGRPADLYPLTALQRGMLFHSLKAPEAHEYLEQLGCRLDEAIDPSALRAAFLTLLARHPPLRTSFAWQGLREPLQVVHAAFSPPWQDVDLRGLSDDEQARRLDQAVQRAQQTSFALDAAPPVSVQLFQLHDDVFHLLLSWHHLLLDGWSMPLLVSEWHALYRAAVNDAAPPPAHPGAFRDLFAWRATQPAPDPAFWPARLAPIRTTTAVSATTTLPAPAAAPRYADFTLRLSEEQTAGLHAALRKQHATLSALLHAALSVALSRCLDRDDVVFGTVVSGRPADLPHVETVLGNFLATVPFCAPRAAATLSSLVAACHQELTALQHHDGHSLSELQRLTSLPRGAAFFEVVLVVDHYPGGDDGLAHQGDGRWRCTVHSRQSTGYPLHVMAVPGPSLELRFTHQEDRLDAPRARALADALLEVTLGLLTPADEASDANTLRTASPALRALWPLPPLATATVTTTPTAAPPPTTTTLMVAPRTPAEEVVAAVWCEVLGVQNVGVHDDFFALGGHSLLATQVASRLRDAFDVELPLGELFAATTVEALALVMERLVEAAVDALSDDEVAAQLSSSAAGGGA